jgi:hypothetical protein
MASLDVIRRITLRAEAEGFEDAARKLQSLGRAEEGIVATSERTERASGRVEQSFRRIEATLDPAAKALQQYERTQKAVQAAQQQGVTTQSRANELLAAAEDRVISAAQSHAQFGKAATAAGEASATMAKNVGLARHELINLSRQAQDVAVSLAGGQSPFTVMLQQGSQIGDVFANSNVTVGQALRGIGSSVLSVFTPARVAIGGVTAGLIGGVVAANNTRRAKRKLMCP